MNRGAWGRWQRVSEWQYWRRNWDDAEFRVEMQCGKWIGWRTYPCLLWPVLVFCDLSLSTVTCSCLLWPVLVYCNLFLSTVTCLCLLWPVLVYCDLPVSTVTYSYLPWPVLVYCDLSLFPVTCPCSEWRFLNFVSSWRERCSLLDSSSVFFHLFLYFVKWPYTVPLVFLISNNYFIFIACFFDRDGASIERRICPGILPQAEPTWRRHQWMYVHHRPIKASLTSQASHKHFCLTSSSLNPPFWMKDHLLSSVD